MLRNFEKQEGKSAYNTLLPIYPLIAQQCVDDYGLNEGICLDIGTGNGYIGTEIAKITNMDMHYVDINPDGLVFARETVEVADIDNQCFFIEADVCDRLPFSDEFADFVVSRGSFWFWKDQVKALAEIYRVLKVGGTAFIGGGLGRYVPASMRKRLMAQRKNKLEKQGVTRPSADEMKQIAIQAGILSFRMVKESEQDTGGWIEIYKYI